MLYHLALSNVLLLLLHPAIAATQSGEIEQMVDHVKAIRFNQPEQALHYAEKTMTLLQQTPNPPAKVRLLGFTATAHMVLGDYAKAIELAEKSRQLAQHTDDEQGLGMAHNHLGTIAFYQTRFDVAFEHYAKALQLMRGINNQRGIADSLNNVAIIYTMYGDDAKALDYYLQSLDIQRQVNDQAGIGIALSNIANVYKHQADLPLSLSHHFKALAIFESIGDNRSAGSALDNIAGIYNAQGKFDEALVNYHQAMKNFEKIGDKANINHILINIGKQYADSGNLAKALITLKQGLQGAQALGVTSSIAFSQLMMAEVYGKQGKFDQAVPLAKTALEIFARQGKKPRVRDAQQVLSEIYQAAGDHAKALEAFQTFKKINDELYNSQSQQKIARLKARVEFDQLQSQVKLLEKEKAFAQAVWVSSTVLIMITLTLGWAFYLHRQKVTRQIGLERLRVRIASDLHDELGSSLTQISLLSDLVRCGAQPESQPRQLETISCISREAITSMSDVIWSIDARNETLGALVDRMTDCSNALLVEQDIQVQFDKSGLPLSSILALEIRRDLYLIFKEAINNCAKHACATTVNIQLGYQDNHLSLSIKDNGCGLTQISKPAGQGLKNINMRAQRLKSRLTIIGDNGVSIKLTGINLT